MKKLLGAKLVGRVALVGVAALLFLASGILGKLVMLAVAGATAWAWWAAKGGKVGLVPTVLVRGLAWAGNALATFGAQLATTRWGRIAGGTVGVLMLADASYGNDGIGLPLLGWPLGVVVALVIGGREWRRRRPYMEQVEEAIRVAVNGYSHTRPPQIVFGEGPGAKWLGRYQPVGSFAFRAPLEVRRADIEGIEQHLREGLPADEGTSWDFFWNMRTRHCSVIAVPDLPWTDWHPYTSGAHGNPLNPVGDPYRIPLGKALGGREVYWEAQGQTSNFLAVGGIGGGKSNALQVILLHMLLFRDYWDCWMIDPKYLEFSDYAEYPNDVIKRVALDLESARELMDAAREEIEIRKPILAMEGVKKIEDYNKKMEAQGKPIMKRLAVFVDEVAELIEPSGGKDPESKFEDEQKAAINSQLKSIAQLGRAFGLNLVYATQRNDANLISGRIKTNTAARIIAGRVPPEASRMAIENDLGTGLPKIPGRSLYFVAGQLQELQVYRVEPEQIEDMAGVMV